ncbi:hypothetical protein COU59_03745 [Candidatus Pacearchaeota archaeon CG10_big_fil_rev_8_21_14_0_10_34_12]|nr:MAG: hypothetical protein COU59_03745 [Candidatus Pacearchaeota archaeon CG10_big_fil_rev_8_21_14_0_10_34_12]
MAETNPECIFCLIASGNTASYKIAEDSKALAVLELNPISKGHILIIPKGHGEIGEKIPEEIAKLIALISKNISDKLKPKDIMAAKASLFGHDVINLVPIYKDEDINSERHPAKKTDLEKLQKILTEENQEIKKPEKKKESIKEVKKKSERITLKNTWLPRRIP